MDGMFICYLKKKSPATCARHQPQQGKKTFVHMRHAPAGTRKKNSQQKTQGQKGEIQ